MKNICSIKFHSIINVLIIIINVLIIGFYINYFCNNNNSCKLEPAIVQDKRIYKKFKFDDRYSHYKFIYRKINTGKLDEIEVGAYDYEKTNKGDTIYIK